MSAAHVSPAPSAPSPEDRARLDYIDRTIGRAHTPPGSPAGHPDRITSRKGEARLLATTASPGRPA